MTGLDWLLVWVPLLFVMGVAAYTQRYNKSVTDFIAAGRCAGRYLLTTARGTAGSAVYTIALFQITYQTGFTFAWWSLLTAPILILVASTGFVFYRYRETRALTVAQFFEMRYSRSFRLFMGGLAFLAGILNYGIFPAVSARFFVYFIGLPGTVGVFSLHVPTWAVIAFVYLSCTLFFVLTGGQISLLLTDCVEGIFSQVGYLVIIVGLICFFSWHEVVGVLEKAPAGSSYLNPFDTKNAHDYNLWFVIIGIFSAIYSTMAWQNSHGFNSAALTPHESRMSNILASWRGFAGILMRSVLVISAITFMALPENASQAESVKATLGQITNPQVQNQMQVPVILSTLLPAGLKGLFCSLMLLGVISGDAIAAHSWGSIFVQDVIMPLRKKPISQREHLRLLRYSIAGVIAFAFGFSLLFPQTQDIILWWTITGVVFTGGAGSVIIGGLYWKKGTTVAAWSSMLTGSILSLTTILLQQMDPDFPLHSQYAGLLVMLIAIGVYVGVSLLTCKTDFDMDRLLHRGEYAIAGEHQVEASSFWRRLSLWKILGIDGEYTFWDRVITIGLFSWTMFWFGVFLIGCVWNLITPWPVAWWENYWLISGIILPFVIAFLSTIWFTWGGIYDLGVFFKRLRVEKRDEKDDGTVVRADSHEADSRMDSQYVSEK